LIYIENRINGLKWKKLFWVMKRGYQIFFFI